MVRGFVAGGEAGFLWGLALVGGRSERLSSEVEVDMDGLVSAARWAQLEGGRMSYVFTVGLGEKSAEHELCGG